MPAVEATLTTRPQPRSAIAGTAARISRIGRHHVQLPGGVPVLLRHVVEVAPARGAGVVDERRRARRSGSVGLGEDPLAGVGVGDVEREVGGAAVRRRRRRARTPRRPRASSSSVRATSRTCAPASQSIRAVARPIPRPAPVTAQARPRGRDPSGRGSTRSRRIVDLDVVAASASGGRGTWRRSSGSGRSAPRRAPSGSADGS